MYWLPQTKVNESGYKEKDKRWNEQFIISIHDDKMTGDNMRTDSIQKEKWSQQWTGTSMGQENWGTMNPKSAKRGIKRK